MKRNRYTYIPNSEIESITTWNGKEIQGSKLLDGAYARGKVQYGEGGNFFPGFIKGDKVLLKDGGGQRMATVVEDGFDNKNRIRVRPDGFPMDISVPMEEKYSDDKRVYVIRRMADGGMMAKGGYASRHRKRTLEEKAEELVGSATWHSLDRREKADVISEMVTEEILPIVAAKGLMVADKYTVTFTLANGKVVKQTYDSKDKMDDGIADMYLENDVLEVKIDEPLKGEPKKSIFDVAKKAEPKAKSSKEKKEVEVQGIESEISRYDELKSIINNAKAEQEVIGGRLKEIGKEKYLELYEAIKSKPDNFNLADGDEKIMFIVMDKYKKVEPEKEVILEQYDGLLEKVTTYSFNPEVLERVGDALNNLIMNSKDISEEDKKKLLVVDTTIAIKKGSIDRLMNYENPEEIFNLIEPILALK